MARLYLSIKEYCEKYNVPRTTVQYWVKKGILNARKDVRPFQIPDDQPIPFKDKVTDSFRYRWKDEKTGFII